MPEKIYNDISGAIAVLAQKLGVAAEHVYATLVRQQIVEGIAAIAAIIAALIGICVVVILGKLCFKLDNEGHEWPVVIIGCIAAVILVFSIGTLVISPSDILKLFNPEYYAIQEIIKMVK